MEIDVNQDPPTYAFLNFRAFVNLYFHQEERNSKMSFIVTILSATSPRLTPLLAFISTDKVISMMHCRSSSMYTRKIVYSKNNQGGLNRSTDLIFEIHPLYHLLSHTHTHTLSLKTIMEGLDWN